MFSRCAKEKPIKWAMLLGVFLQLGAAGAFAGDWGEDWGSLLWGAGSSAPQPVPVPVDSTWMLVAVSLAAAAISALKMRK